MEVFLHLGAHKTASTHLQNALTDHDEALRGQGIACVDLVYFREHLSPLLWQMQHGGDRDAARGEANRILTEYADGASCLIVSEENLLGRAVRPNAVNRFYPECEANLLNFLDVLDAPPARLFLATRCLETYLVSAYVERLRHSWVEGFSAFLAGTRPHLLSWARLTARLIEASGGLPVTVWRYEDYRDIGPEVARELTGMDVPLSDRMVRRGLSARGVEEVEKAGRAGRDVVAEKLVDKLVRKYPKGADWPAYDPWSEDERAGLRERYASDFARLGEMEGVTLITP